MSTRPPLPPGPRLRSTLRLLRERRRSPLRFFQSIAREYGDVALLRLGPAKFVVLSHPDHAQHLLADHAHNYEKGWIYDPLRVVLGQGLLTSEGELWRRQRKLAAPVFGRPSLEGMLRVMEEPVEAMLRRWEAWADDGTAFDVYPEVLALTLEIATRTLLGGSMTDAEKGAFNRDVSFAVDRANARLVAPVKLPLSFPTPNNLRLRRAVKRLDTAIYRIIDARRADPARPGDFLGLLMDARDEETGEAIPRRQVRDEAITFVIAGYETNSCALSWVLALLSQHPDVRRRMLAEIDGVDPTQPRTVDGVMSLGYTLAVVQEAMRLYPPAWLYGRNARVDDVVGGFRVPRGSIAMVSPYVLHHDARFWENPEGFDPEHFLTPDPDRSRFAYLPFSRGPRQCIGNHFALLELALILTMISQRLEVDLVPGFALEPNPRVALEPKHGVRVVARHRRR